MSQRNRRSQASDSLNASSQSQSTRRGNRTVLPTSPDAENYDQYTVAAVKFILNQLSTKYPIKRADLVNECCNGNGRIFSIILSAVQNHLKTVYGIIFHEVTSVKGSNKQYICCAENPSVSILKLRKCDRKNGCLLMLILSYIFVKGTSVSESALLNFLLTLGIDIDREHEYFGDMKKSLETFRKQLYIKREKQQTEASNEERVMIEWGERAVMEFDKKTMLVEVAQAFQKPTLFFKKQHMELMIEPEDMEEEA